MLRHRLRLRRDRPHRQQRRRDGDEKHVVRAIEAGATGYLLKERGSDHVVDSILSVLDGASPVSPRAPSAAAALWVRLTTPALDAL